VTPGFLASSWQPKQEDYRRRSKGSHSQCRGMTKTEDRKLLRYLKRKKELKKEDDGKEDSDVRQQDSSFRRI